jgi:hypothetical protein
MRRRLLGGPRLLAVLVLAAAPFLLSLTPVSKFAGGSWPNDWPVELEDVRADATSIYVGTGIQQAIYQIPFKSREQFEAVWPGVLRAKSPGGTLTLYRVGSQGEGGPGVSNEEPAVRIYAPSRAFSVAPQAGDAGAPTEPPTLEQLQALVEQGRALRADEPWPKSAYLPNGDLAEYVTSKTVDGRMTWVAVGQSDDRLHDRSRSPLGFNLPVAVGQSDDRLRDLHRARADIVLVVDGEIVDLNRIHLPPDTKVIDKRGLAGSDG